MESVLGAMDNTVCNKSFSTNYLFLTSEKISLLDLIRILIYREIETIKYLECPGKTREVFELRWLIFFSILIQKLLHCLAKPMAWLGFLIEMWLNLLSCNDNLPTLLFNLFREYKIVSTNGQNHGKLVIPKRRSKQFLSIIGHIDKRMDLDKNIIKGYSRYYVVLSMMAAKVSYENTDFIKSVVRDHWKMDFLGSFGFWNDYQGKVTTNAFILREKTNENENIILAFRGTEAFDANAWCIDFDISWYEILGLGKVHGGFMKALGLIKCKGWPKKINREESNNNHPPLAYYFLRQKLIDIIGENDRAKFMVTGHSLGGALAILFVGILAFHEEEKLLERIEGVYTFGQPRVGDEKFGEFMKEKLGKFSVPYYRFVYGNDMVPRLPYDNSTFMFKHFGTCLYYDCFYQGKIILEELPNKNYSLQIWAIIPSFFTAIWEFIRSFSILYTKGPEYREGLVLRVFRLIGVVIPGMPAHSTHDYVNATRLGSPELYKLAHTWDKINDN